METQSIPFFRFAMNMALEHQQHFKDRPLTAEQQAAWDAMAAQSIVAQQDIEAGDRLSFDDYLAQVAEEYLPLVS